MAFSLHDFVIDTLTRMINGDEPDYQVMQLALRWYEKGVLVDADMESIETFILKRETDKAAQEAPVVDFTEETPVDEVPVEETVVVDEAPTEEEPTDTTE